MIHFNATIELLICMLGATVLGVLFGAVFESFFTGLAATIGLFCLFVDCLFSYSVEDDGSWDD